MPQRLKYPADIGTAVKRAIRHLSESEGSSFVDIKKYLSSKYRDNRDVLDLTNIKQFLKNAVDTGVLLKLDNTKYKVKETARRRRSRSRSRSGGARRRRSRSRKRSGGRRRSRSVSRKRRRSSSGRKRSTSGRRRRRRRAIGTGGEE